ncbi:hypothetical protein DCCM_4544 [Desulfocucumis palustris]|uniref:Uncharacterized protein n=1 Tax=Desulfocucumis palustris TaxID=1898651 RepID=A0A2L2XGE1_9FIRM|nr:MobP3 family relaxase [Desulfocucumis palustris]GBF35417.1 hypothetical protein DCCM_4544 [Desulfocucumis palustris]
MRAPFIFKMSFYKPGDGNEAKNACHILYIGTRPGADRGEGDVEIGDKESSFYYKYFVKYDEDEAAKHVKYASERPRSHGLFGRDEKNVPDLEAVQNELWRHKGIVWRAVLSLREDDAIRMGYDNRKAWEDALRASVPEAAGKMGISEENLRWVAAFHAEPGHPHCHLVFWEAKPERTRGVLSKGKSSGELIDVRKVFVQRILAGERARLGGEKTLLRDMVRDFGRNDVRELLKEMRSEQNYVRSIDGAAGRVSPRLNDDVRAALSEKLEQIAGMLPGKGRVALKYMPPEVKEKLRDVADWLLKQPGFSESVGRYVEIAREMASHYSHNVHSLDESGRNAYEDLRDRLSQDLLKGAVEIGKVERASDSSCDDLVKDGGSLEGFEGDAEPPEPESGQLENYVEPLESEPAASGMEPKASGTAGSSNVIPGGNVKEVSEKLVEDAWRTVDRAVFRVDPSVRLLRGEMPAIEAGIKEQVIKSLKEISGLIPEDSLKGRIALAYLPREVKERAREVAGQLLESDVTKPIIEKYFRLAGGGQGSDAFRQIKERVAEQVVERAAELLTRVIPPVIMLPHKGRVEDAVALLKGASADYIRGNMKEVKWTVGSMYRALTMLGVDEAERITANWAAGAGIKDFKKILSDAADDKKRKHISRKGWTRLRENLGLEDEECLYPWFGVVQEQKQLPEEGGQQEQEKEDIPHVLVESRIASALNSLESAADKPGSYAEVYWTARAFCNTLHALGVGEEERARIIRGWVERSGVEVSEAKLRDVLDRVTVAPREGFWLGRSGWVRLSVNLGVTVPAAVPWKITTSPGKYPGADKNKVAGELWRDAWHTSERAIHRLDGGGCESVPKIEDGFRAEIAGKLKTIADLIPEESLKGRLALAYLPQEVKERARDLAGQLLQSGKLALRTEKFVEQVCADQGEDAGKEAFHELKERVAEQVVGRAVELLPREIPQVEMLPHDGRVQDAVKRFESATAEYIRSDIDEARWTAGTMYRALVRLGVDGQAAREATERWADGVGLKKEAARAISGEIVRMECIAQECREENKPEPVHVSRKDWTRLRENLGMEEEECLYPWFGILREQEQLPENEKQQEKETIPHELIDKRISPALHALEGAAGNPENYAEVYWTLRTFANTLHALGVGEEDSARMVRGWVERSGVEVSEARLRDVLDRVTVVPKEDFWLGRRSWNRLTENLGIHNPPASPWRANVDRYGNIAGQLWKAVWRNMERERTKLEAKRLVLKRMNDMRRQRAKEGREID